MRYAFPLLAGSALIALLAPMVGSAAPERSGPAVPATAGQVIVQEIAASGSRSLTDSFIELRNTADHAVDLGGWQLFRCDGEGLRAKKTRTEADLGGVVLQPGELFTVAHMSAMLVDADARFTQSLDPTGFGVVLVDPSGATADAVAVYPNEPHATQSECGEGPNLPVTLAAALDESWQRTEAGAWVRARSTPAAENRVGADPVSPARVRIDEIAPAGPGGHGDDFVELVNAGPAPVDTSGWRLYRCTRDGVLTHETLRHEFGDGSRLAPDERFVVAGPAFTGEYDTRDSVSLADIGAGALLVDAVGRRVDGIAVSSGPDSACQSGDDKLAAELDYRGGESWQRTAAGAVLAAIRTPGEANAERASTALTAAHAETPSVAISEVATDPELPGSHGRRNFVELANYSDRVVDASGWTLIACGANGFRRFDNLATLEPGTRIRPGETWVAALRGTSAALVADASYEVALELAGAGVWLEDAAGRKIDSAGIFHRNEMDRNNEPPSPCTNGLSAPTFAVDRLHGETYQRVGFTGNDADDLVAASATPGELVQARAATTEELARDAAGAAERTAVSPGAAVPAAATRTPGGSSSAEVLSAVAGRSAAPLTEHSAPGESNIDVTSLVARDDAYDHPYLRLRVAAPSGGMTAGWRGRVVGRGAVRLSVWNPVSATWRTLDETAGASVAGEAGAAGSTVQLSGVVRGDEVSAGEAEMLVQSIPRASSLDDAPELADPGDYDLAVSHLTDTQYYSEAYPEVYAAQVAWIAANADDRRIAFAAHTGDLVQNWIDPDQSEVRARFEFERASRFQAVLDGAGIPNSVLPGNHDSKRGVTYDLFNEYFPPSRYADRDWFGGSIAPDDNRAGYATFRAAGAAFLVVTLPYAYGEEEVAWAENVVRQHPDHNVVVATHEHLTPKTREATAARSNSSRWLSQADLLWDRLIAPHRNVVLVLSGHFHGLGAIVTEDAGGIPGHTVVEALADYQEFRTHSGERATGFQRMLQFDLGGGRLAVDTLSVPLGAVSSHPYDYRQFVPDDGDSRTGSNERPWNIVADGLQHRYTEADDAFTVDLALQHAKAVETDGVWVAPVAAGTLDG